MEKSRKKSRGMRDVIVLVVVLAAVVIIVVNTVANLAG
jgi:hypothetical protein